MKYISFLLCLCLLSGCTAQPGGSTEASSPAQGSQSEEATESLTPDSLDALLDITNARRRAIVKPTPDTSVVNDWQIEVNKSPSSEISFGSQPAFSPDDVYTLEEARGDVDYLFYFYQLGYGPYFYFGGKSAFDAAKEGILADLENMTEITASAFEASLIQHLSFVGDGHFVINQNYNLPAVQGYLSRQAFLQDTAGFTEVITGKRVQSIGGQEDFWGDMVLSLTPEGDVVYRYLKLAQEQPDPVELAYEDGTTKTSVLYSAHKTADRPEGDDSFVSLSRVDGIPVITVTTMGFPHAASDKDANYFLSLAEELRDEPALIIDLRRNGGGNGLLPQMWFEAYTGACLTPNHYGLLRLDIYDALGWESSPSEPDLDNPYYIPADVLDYYQKRQTVNESWELTNPEPREVIEHDQLLIVLTNKNTASSADNFTDLAFNVENTLVIGCNTAGMLISSASMGLKMPNSDMVGQMGFNLSVFDEDHFQEGTGFMPDLWVIGDPLEEAVALAKQRLSP